MASGVISEAILVNLGDPRYFQHGGNLMVRAVDFFFRYEKLLDVCFIQISFPRNEDSGTYFCKATNFFGTAISNRVYLREISTFH